MTYNEFLSLEVLRYYFIFKKYTNLKLYFIESDIEINQLNSKLILLQNFIDKASRLRYRQTL